MSKADEQVVKAGLIALSGIAVALKVIDHALRWAESKTR